MNLYEEIWMRAYVAAMPLVGTSTAYSEPSARRAALANSALHDFKQAQAQGKFKP